MVPPPFSAKLLPHAPNTTRPFLRNHPPKPFFSFSRSPHFFPALLKQCPLPRSFQPITLPSPIKFPPMANSKRLLLPQSCFQFRQVCSFVVVTYIQAAPPVFRDEASMNALSRWLTFFLSFRDFPYGCSRSVGNVLLRHRLFPLEDFLFPRFRRALSVMKDTPPHDFFSPKFSNEPFFGVKFGRTCPSWRPFPIF